MTESTETLKNNPKTQKDEEPTNIKYSNEGYKTQSRISNKPNRFNPKETSWWSNRNNGMSNWRLGQIIELKTKQLIFQTNEIGFSHEDNIKTSGKNKFKQKFGSNRYRKKHSSKALGKHNKNKKKNYLKQNNKRKV